ncbi:hypothetical protein [Streptomyces humidus]|nr:hypothetical protein [Streptomyces humidus]
MPTDPYAVLRALLRAEAVRSTPPPAPQTKRQPRPEQPQAKRDR